ncbi:hypothetical protein [Stakelama tenebrarum]|uniref:Secreted protein n=1 Tax=Stakelama tenebrarum TaxID=2711215 RepID=A0A6G6Y1J8_9SPHN|nr:hypothetical protein [Sphingosinithalassobacter tenebrarum]QIG78814.1 hypothetical protein G5C33_02745 [Sphingosinithalassobacter tenebrarum]
MGHIASTLSLIFALSLAAPAVAQDRDTRELGVETSIPFADNNGIRNWEAGEVGSNALYVQDNRRRWYRVELVGPCMSHHGSFQLVYQTGPMGSFDTRTRVASSDFPGQWCNVVSVKTSAPPPGHDDRRGDAEEGRSGEEKQ